MKAFKTLLFSFVGIALAAVLGFNASAAAPSPALTTSASARLAGGGTVQYQATLLGIPQSDDGIIYLYALQPYEYAVTVASPCVGQVPASQTPIFAFPLGDNICNKFAMAVKVGGIPVTISGGQYITNPEAAATATRPVQNVGFVEPYEKMGLYRVGELSPALFKAANYSTTVIVNKSNPNLIHPYAKIGDSHPISQKMYYAFNAANATGVNALKNEMRTLAATTNIDEFIFGNEVNNRKWNYMAFTDWDTYVREYVQAFRVAYNSIKSTNANATVYISLDQNWNRNRTPSHGEYYEYMDDMDFLLAFNGLICAEGNIDWGLAAHPYPTPLTYAKFWDLSELPNGDYYRRMVTSNAQVTFQNLPVLTNFMAAPGMRNPAGNVRNIILPEIGLTSAQGVEVQAAAYMACYTACRNNPAIKRVYFHRMNEGGALNFGTSGISEQVYQCLLRGDTASYDAWAKNFIGITDWRQIVSY